MSKLREIIKKTKKETKKVGTEERTKAFDYLYQSLRIKEGEKIYILSKGR